MVCDFGNTTIILQLYRVYPSGTLSWVVYHDNISMEINELENWNDLTSRSLVESNSEWSAW